jgi:hypothetical protein
MIYGYDMRETPNRAALYATVWVEVRGRRVFLHATQYRKALAQVRIDAQECLAAIQRACK